MLDGYGVEPGFDVIPGAGVGVDAGVCDGGRGYGRDLRLWKLLVS